MLQVRNVTTPLYIFFTRIEQYETRGLRNRVGIRKWSSRERTCLGDIFVGGRFLCGTKREVKSSAVGIGGPRCCSAGGNLTNPFHSVLYSLTPLPPKNRYRVVFGAG
jgi:hypothetical protein